MFISLTPTWRSRRANSRICPPFTPGMSTVFTFKEKPEAIAFLIPLNCFVMRREAASSPRYYEDVIGVGGSGKGADTAIVLRATYPAFLFDKDPAKRLEIKEVIAMSIAKKWWE